ncbi:MAG: hypothetical protein JST59_29270 [Actinobacteria bacterium]|nr:hypothetical protein [Actinomycetota bacterium]
MLIALTLAGWGIAAMLAWETLQPLLIAAFVVLLPASVAVIVLAIRSIV